jgi:hypothetical protein
LYTPIVQLGQGPTQPLQADATTNGVSPVIPALVPEQNLEEVVAQNPPPVVLQVVPATATRASRKAFDFGVAQFDASSGLGGVGEDMNGKTLADIAREQRQHPSGTDVRVYSNNDIEKLNQVGGTVSTPSARANNASDNWSPNNGVITPEPSQPPQNAVGAPAQQNQMPTGNQSPFAPKPRSNNPTGTTPNQPQSHPQSEARPFARREGVEIAQNNPQNAPLAQSQADNSSKQNTPAETQPQAKQLPHTASRLPIVGLAGLFSVSMGIFVRYQRSKAK